jgi:uncharacterized protein
MRRFFQVHTNYRPLRLNVGFLLSQTAGYGRLFDFREDSMTLGSDIRVEAFTGHLQLNRTPQGIVAKGDFTGGLPAECARCLTAFSAPVSIHLEDLFVYPPQNATDPLLLVGEDAHLNLEPLMREYLLVNQPTRPLCRPDCKGLCPICGNDLNEKECFHPEESEVREIMTSALILSTQKPPQHAKAAERKPAQSETKNEKKASRVKATVQRKTSASKTGKHTKQSGGKSPAGKKPAGGATKIISKKK